MNIQPITSEMLKKQPDQTSYILNNLIDKVNKGVTSGGGGGGGDITVVQTTGTSTTAVMSQNAVTRELGRKVNSVAGKGLSANDYTNTDKNKVDNMDTSISTAVSNHNSSSEAHEDIREDIEDITDVIPNQASSSNQLADKNFVNSSINSVTAYYITKNAVGDQFNSKAELDAATIFYSGGEIRVPTRNDYCIVLADETHADPITGEFPTTRYIYQNGWEFQYVVNKTSLTAAQLAAVNSGITEEKVEKLDTVEEGAQVNVKPDWEASSSASAGILNKPENLVQDANYVHTDNNYTTAEKTKLAGLNNSVLYGSTGHNVDGAMTQNASTVNFIQSSDGTATTPTPDVSTSRIVEGAVTTSKLADGAVTSAKIANDFMPLTTIVKNLSNTNNWADTGIDATSFATGTYIISASVSNSNIGLYSETYSGVMTWYSGVTNSSNSCEIILHNAGHADNSNRLFLRTTRMPSSGHEKLQYAYRWNNAGSSDITFNFRRII